ncbi:MAG TPA: SprT-like domain-containing protein [Gemmatimonadaceae bacterium]|nr:SprT-like domain-containing protein [Gemmatimonadaceae bacterium]
MFRALTGILRRGTVADPAQLALGIEAPRTAEELLQRLRACGLRGVNRCVLTRNRTVLVSVRGESLRVHAGFLTAPDEVLRAIAMLAGARSRAARLEARRVIVSYPVVAPGDEAGASARRVVRRTHTQPADAPMAERLRLAHARLNARHFAGGLGVVDVEVSRRMKRRLGHFAPGAASGATSVTPEIAISRRHIRRDGWTQAEQTLLHEMVHQWQHETGRTLDHGRDFRRKAREVGIEPRATRRTGSAGNR